MYVHKAKVYRLVWGSAVILQLKEIFMRINSRFYWNTQQ